MRLFTRLTKAVIFSVAIFSASLISAQDLHFSQYYTQASTLNPSLVGNYDGSYRLAAIYRNQWANAVGGKDAFQTIGADVDFCLLEGYLKTDKLAIGVGFFNDRSGAAGLSQLEANLTLAYHKGFGKDGKHRLSVGLQGAYLQKRVDDPIFGDQFLGHNETLLNSSAENFNRGFYRFDFNAGLYWRSNFNDRVKLGVGFGAYHLITPKESTVISQATGGLDNNTILPRKYDGDLNLEIFVTKPNGERSKASLTPEILVMYQEPYLEILPGISGTYYFSTGFRNNNSISLGVRYRYAGVSSGTSDAIIPMANIEFRNVRLGFAYDANISPLKTSTNNRGAFELSLVYIGETIKSFKANKSLPSRRF